MRKKDIGTEEVLYRLGLVAALVAATGFLFVKYAPPAVKDWISHFSFCVIYRFTGFTCPGCGGTRAVAALFRGHVLESILYHPLVVYGIVLYVLFMGSHTLAGLSRLLGKVRALRTGKREKGAEQQPEIQRETKRETQSKTAGLQGMKWRDGYVTAAVWLLAANFIIKNLIHLLTGTDVLAELAKLFAR